MLTADNLKVYHGPIEAVHGVTFKVDQGQCVCLLGPNGAGKTSTICALAGLVSSSGKVIFDGHDISAHSVEARVAAGLSVSPEGRRVFSNLSVEENLTLGGALRRDPKARLADINHWFEQFPVLGQRRNQPAGTLSGGEQQMLAISRALMNRPKILLLDEPSLGLAPLIVNQIFSLVRQLCNDGVTVLLVEQNAAQAMKLADYVYLLNSGYLVAQGEPQALGQREDLMAELTGIS